MTVGVSGDISMRGVRVVFIIATVGVDAQHTKLSGVYLFGDRCLNSPDTV